MNNLYVRLAKNNLKNNKSLYVPYMVAGMITVLMFYIMMFINNSAGLQCGQPNVNLRQVPAQVND